MSDNRIAFVNNAFNKFMPDLSSKVVLTEAATGNFVCTSVLAALAGAYVYAIGKSSKYGSIDLVHEQVYSLSDKFGVSSQIKIVENKDDIPFQEIDVVTNTGFVRPIDRAMLNKLKPDCVIPLMWEPWEYRKQDLDLDYATARGIKVYGTNESDPRLRTLEYLGFTVLYFLLNERRSPSSARILIMGYGKFVESIYNILVSVGYHVDKCNVEAPNFAKLETYNFIVLADNVTFIELIGYTSEALLQTESLGSDTIVLHIAGNVNFENARFKYYPSNPAPPQHMSYTTDFIDPAAVYDLHTAGMKVAEGMCKANSMKLGKPDYKYFLEHNYPALSFPDLEYW